MRLIESHKVEKIKPNIRLSDYIHNIFESLPSRKSGKKVIKKGLVHVNGTVASTGIIVRKGMNIQLFRKKISKADKTLPKAKILFEDEEIIVALKPAGITTSGHSSDHLLARVQSAINSETIIKTVHRIDKATTGIVVFAKTTNASENLSFQFRKGLVEKTYLAIVSGEIAEAGRISLSIDGKDSHTAFTRLKVYPSAAYDKISLVRLKPKSGRKHQLRKHLKALNHPIVGDQLYSKEGKITRGKGMCLVASSIAFQHPIKKQNLSIEIDIPKNFHKVLPFKY